MKHGWELPMEVSVAGKSHRTGGYSSQTDYRNGCFLSLSLPAYIIYTYIRMYIYYTHTHILYAHNVCVYIYIYYKLYIYIYMYMYSKRENPLYAETLNGWSHHALSFKNVLAVIGAGERSGCTGLRYGLIMGHTLDIC